VRKNELLALIRQGLKDFSVSRARVKWGIPVPEQPDHVLYVWVDALANYITALGFADGAPDYQRYWVNADERMHLIGKDIIRFHNLYWPAVLHAAGVPVPTREFAQGFITRNGRRLSKTTGNVIDPQALVEQHGPDAVRYFLLREAPYGEDWDFTEQAFLNRYNADLANDLGNLVSRALTMVQRYCGGKVPGEPQAGLESYEYLFGESKEPPPEDHKEEDVLLREKQRIFSRYEALDFAGALVHVWASWVRQLNQSIVREQPWEKAKNPALKAGLDHYLYRLLEGVRLVAVFLSPVMPGACRRIHAMLGLGEREPRPDDLRWGVLAAGSPLGEVTPLFPRIETKPKETPSVSDDKPQPPAPPAAADDGRIDISDFAKVELRVAQILTAEKIPGSKKLVKLQVDLGTERRQLVAGIAESYAPETLPGKKVAVVANLKPAKLMGVESQGMVLAAEAGGKATLLAFDGDPAPGTKIK
jgi:methionyl-tRNA synthetase